MNNSFDFIKTACKIFESRLSRDVLLKHIRAETKAFFQELFGSVGGLCGRVESDAFTDMTIRLKETESALNETLEKRNQLETERIQLLDQIAELRVSLGLDFKHIINHSLVIKCSFFIT